MVWYAPHRTVQYTVACGYKAYVYDNARGFECWRLCLSGVGYSTELLCCGDIEFRRRGMYLPPSIHQLINQIRSNKFNQPSRSFISFRLISLT